MTNEREELVEISDVQAVILWSEKDRFPKFRILTENTP